MANEELWSPQEAPCDDERRSMKGSFQPQRALITNLRVILSEQPGELKLDGKFVLYSSFCYTWRLVFLVEDSADVAQWSARRSKVQIQLGSFPCRLHVQLFFMGAVVSSQSPKTCSFGKWKLYITRLCDLLCLTGEPGVPCVAQWTLAWGLAPYDPAQEDKEVWRVDGWIVGIGVSAYNEQVCMKCSFHFLHGSNYPSRSNDLFQKLHTCLILDGNTN